MFQKMTAILMFVIAISNALSLGAEERAVACESVPAAATISHGSSLTVDITQAAVSSQHHESNDCNDCHDNEGCHQCHLGHCHSVIVAGGSSSLLIPNSLQLRSFADFSWMSIHLPSPDKPPRA